MPEGTSEEAKQAQLEDPSESLDAILLLRVCGREKTQTLGSAIHTNLIRFFGLYIDSSFFTSHVELDFEVEEDSTSSLI